MQEILEKFSSDNLEELKEAVAKHRDYIQRTIKEFLWQTIYIVGVGG